MKHIVHGALCGPDQQIQTEIEFDGTIAINIILTFDTPKAAQAYRTNLILQHTLAFFEELRIEDHRVHLRRKPIDEGSS